MHDLNVQLMQIYYPILPYRHTKARIYILASTEVCICGIKSRFIQWHNRHCLPRLIGGLLTALGCKIPKVGRHSNR